MLPSQTLFTGTQAAYRVVCETKLWLFSNGVSMEHSSDLVRQGRAIHETRYKREKKDRVVDSRIGIDFIREGDRIVLHEVKKSAKLEKAHVMQFLCYLRALREKGVEATGRIDYPLARRTREVLLTPEGEAELERAERRIREVLALQQPPQPEKKRYCRACSYFELCWT